MRLLCRGCGTLLLRAPVITSRQRKNSTSGLPVPRTWSPSCDYRPTGLDLKRSIRRLGARVRAGGGGKGVERRKIPLRRSPPPLLQQATGASGGRGRNAVSSLISCFLLPIMFYVVLILHSVFSFSSLNRKISLPTSKLHSVVILCLAFKMGLFSLFPFCRFLSNFIV